ncbi:hypothetical protein GEMRC1_005377 [Eukaryota sp. GEM-RC1]
MLGLISNLFTNFKSGSTLLDDSESVSDKVNRFLSYWENSVELFCKCTNDPEQKRNLLVVLYCLSEILEDSNAHNNEVFAVIRSAFSKHGFVKFLVQNLSSDDETSAHISLVLIKRFSVFDFAAPSFASSTLVFQITHLMLQRQHQVAFLHTCLELLSNLAVDDKMSSCILNSMTLYRLVVRICFRSDGGNLREFAFVFVDWFLDNADDHSRQVLLMERFSLWNQEFVACC